MRSSDVKYASIQVTGLPYRLRLGAEKEEALRIWQTELNRYLHNHDDGACGEITGHNAHHKYIFIHTSSALYLNPHFRSQLQELGFDEHDCVQVQALINRYKELLQELEQLKSTGAKTVERCIDCHRQLPDGHPDGYCPARDESYG